MTKAEKKNERGVLMSPPMVLATLAGRKTVTRRIIKDSKNYSCPYGDPPDRLWVRETFVIEDPREYWADLSRNGPPTDRPVKWIDDDYGHRPLIPHYRATEPEPHIVREDTMIDADEDRTRWKPSIFMPRWASRITLEITGVRVERLQEITPEDAIAEGLAAITKDGGQTTKYGISDRDGLPGCDDFGMNWREWSPDPVNAFARLWGSINGPRGPESWAANPFVWVIEFKKIRG